MLPTEVQRILLLIGLAATGYLMILAWNEDYMQAPADAAYSNAPQPQPLPADAGAGGILLSGGMTKAVAEQGAVVVGRAVRDALEDCRGTSRWYPMESWRQLFLEGSHQGQRT